MPKRSPFTQDQLAFLRAKFPEYTQAVNTYDPHWKGNCHQLSKWLTDLVEDLLLEPVFATFDRFNSKADMAKAMKRQFTNHFQYQMRVKGKGRVDLPDNVEGVVNPTTKAYKRAAFISFSNTITPRDLFIADNEEEISKKYKSMKKEGAHGPGVRQSAIAALWEEADQAEWAEKAKSYTYDVHKNQQEFSKLAATSFQNLLESRQLGNYALCLFFGGRGEDNMVHCGKLNLAYDASKGLILDTTKCHFGDDDDQARWVSFLESILPRNSPTVKTQFKRTETGVPLFPEVDLDNMTSREVLPIIEDYLLVSWDHSQEGSTTIPWDAIEEYPYNFYDNTVYLLPIRLQCPSMLSAREIIPLASYFMENQFVFYPKSEIGTPPRTQPLPPSHADRNGYEDAEDNHGGEGDNGEDSDGSEAEDALEEEVIDAVAVDSEDEEPDGSVRDVVEDLDDENSDDADPDDEDPDDKRPGDEMEYEDLDGVGGGEMSSESERSDSPSEGSSDDDDFVSLKSFAPMRATQPKRNTQTTTLPISRAKNIYRSSSSLNSASNSLSAPRPVPNPRPVQAHATAPSVSSLKIKLPPSVKPCPKSPEYSKEVAPPSNLPVPVALKKRGRPPKGSATAGPSLSVSATAGPSSVDEGERDGIRRGGRKRTLAQMGPALVSDPSKPLSKRLKASERWAWQSQSPAKK